MDLVKAVEIGELNIKVAGNKMPADALAAIKLLVESGKTIVSIRNKSFRGTLLLLPGETED